MMAAVDAPLLYGEQQRRYDNSGKPDRLSHLDRLESESIDILREVAASFRNPVMLYSIGKDSAVMLHLAMKAFLPGRPPFPILHIDTKWKFREMIAFRDETVSRPRGHRSHRACQSGRAWRNASARSPTDPRSTQT
jgi:3'-phosphoadenosine 5'-phosphosulfate sulfotransferase (PAPS reductase)/FAD synthetase